MRASRLAPVIVLAAAVLASGCSRQAARTRTAASPNPIPTAVARQTTVRATSIISGYIAPLQNVAITSALSEPADRVLVNEGDRVKAGQVLAVLDTADLRAQLAQAQATVESDIRTAASNDAKVAQTRYTATLNIGTGNNQVTSAQAALAQAKQNLANDQLNLTRDKELVSEGYLAQQTLDQQQTTVVNDQAAIRNAEANVQTASINQSVNGNASNGLQAANVASAVADANASHAVVDQARAQVLQLQTSIAKATIVSPVDGVVVNRNLNPGEYPGSRTIFTVQQLNDVYAELDASGADTFAVPQGASVTLAVPGSNAKSYQGKVVAVLGQVTPGSTNFTIKVLVVNSDGRLQAGLPVTATRAPAR